MDFFPEPPAATGEEDPYDQPQPVWVGPPEDMIPGVVPLELVLGRSETGVVLLTGIRAFPTGLGMSLGVRIRGPVAGRDLNDQVFDSDYRPRDVNPTEHASRLKWGFELSDGRRVTNVDTSPYMHQPIQAGQHDPEWVPDHPVLHGGGGGGGGRSVDRDYWLWPLPPAGRLRVVCQWLARNIDLTIQDLDTGPFLNAAQRAQTLWPTPSENDLSDL